MAAVKEELRVLLPSKPQDDLGDVQRLLSAMLPARATHVRRLYVYRPVEADFYIPEVYPRFQELAQLELDAETATRVESEQKIKPLVAAGFRVSAEVVRGTPTEEIFREASIWRADLVAVRTRSLAAEDHRIGGMASALLYHATCPVLTHHAVPAGYRLRRILIATDFSKSSRKSADWGLALAEITGAEPTLLHVIARWNSRHGIHQDELLAIATQELERWRARVDPVLSRPVKEARVIEASTPAEGILSFAKQHDFDLIVLSATGASAVRAILVGANTRKVVRASVCPVFVVPASNRASVGSFLERARGFSPREQVAGATRAGAGGGCL
jgi:nucleotide-binding universal stress UspA family protein